MVLVACWCVYERQFFFPSPSISFNKQEYLDSSNERPEAEQSCRAVSQHEAAIWARWPAGRLAAEAMSEHACLYMYM